MTMASHIAARWLALVLCLLAFMPLTAFANGRTLDACYRWPQNRLIIGSDLQSRRFELEPCPGTELMFNAAGGRSILRQTFTLSLDIAERVSLFTTSAPRTCVLARDRERTAPLKIPVFFVGRSGELQEELKENAGNLAFAPSESLDIGSDFPDISFHLRRGGSRFSEIRPFFQCGLAGLLVCETSCPEDSVALAASLVNELIKSKPPVQPPAAQKEASAPPAAEPPPARQANPAPEKPPAKPGSATKAPPANPAPPVTEAPPASQSRPPPNPVSSSESAPPPASGPAAPPASSPAAGPVPPASAPQTAPSAEPAPAQPAQPRLKRLVLAFERKTSEPIAADDVSKAEGPILIEGAPLQVTPEGLAASLPDEAFQKASDPEYLQRLFRRHRILDVKKQPGRILLTVEPRYVRADDLTIRINDAAGEPVRGCDLALDVSAERRLGEGWAKLGAKERARGLIYAETDILYELDLPLEIEPNELLISTAEPGNVARLSNTAPGCELEARLVSVEEVRSRKIVRLLQKTGPVLISILSTDSSFADSTSPAGADGFWVDALGLVNTISGELWERKVLARAQAPGPSPETAVLEVETDGAPLAAGKSREEALKALSEGSRLRPGPLSIFPIRPIERYSLDLALKPIRDDASISPRHSIKQEALLIVLGSVKETGSYFCQHSVRRDKKPWASPQWVKQARKIFALEVWSEGAVEAMRQASRLKPAEGAPEGVYVCNIPGADGEKIALYGIVPKAVSDGGARAEAFTYLTGQANSFLKP